MTNIKDDDDDPYHSKDDQDLQHNPWFRIEQFPGERGRGLIAQVDIPPRTLLHVAPCIPIARKEYEQHMQHTVLEHYLFNGKGGNKLLALGYGSLFNHNSNSPNVDYRIDNDNSLVRYFSGHSKILAGTELCIFYGGNLWFEEDGPKNDASSSSSDDEDEVLQAFGGMQVYDDDDENTGANGRMTTI